MGCNCKIHHPVFGLDDESEDLCAVRVHSKAKTEEASSGTMREETT